MLAIGPGINTHAHTQTASFIAQKLPECHLPDISREIRAEQTSGSVEESCHDATLHGHQMAQNRNCFEPIENWANCILCGAG